MAKKRVKYGCTDTIRKDGKFMIVSVKANTLGPVKLGPMLFKVNDKKELHDLVIKALMAELQHADDVNIWAEVLAGEDLLWEDEELEQGFSSVL